MPIICVSDQNSRTLETFYRDLSTHTGWKTAARMMVNLLASINRLFVQTRLWGVTSHADLVIRAEDATTPPWYLVVDAVTQPGHYRFTYRPYTAGPAAWVKVTATSLQEAERHLLVAMRECGAWADNPELQRLLQAARLS